jgi:hypothetical protein
VVNRGVHEDEVTAKKVGTCAAATTGTRGRYLMLAGLAAPGRQGQKDYDGIQESHG